MGFFNRMRVASRAFKDELKRPRKNERDDICAGLQTLRIDAQMAERGQPEEDIGSGASLGLIDIPEGPIRWINVRHLAIPTDPSITYYCIDYAVPDLRTGVNPRNVRIRTVRKKTFPIHGKVVDLHWRGKDSDLGIIDRLNSDYQLKSPIMRSLNHDINIRFFPNTEAYDNVWIISHKLDHAPGRAFWVELWSCWQAIAHHLLAKWTPS